MTSEDFTLVLSQTLEIDGNIVKARDKVKIKVPGITRPKLYIVQEVDSDRKMIRVNSHTGNKWFNISKITNHYPN